jgi:hypothetical protein
MGTVARWLAAAAIVQPFALGLGSADALRSQAPAAPEGWFYYENNDLGCLSRTWDGVETGQALDRCPPTLVASPMWTRFGPPSRPPYGAA